MSGSIVGASASATDSASGATAPTSGSSASVMSLTADCRTGVSSSASGSSVAGIASTEEIGEVPAAVLLPAESVFVVDDPGSAGSNGEEAPAEVEPESGVGALADPGCARIGSDLGRRGDRRGRVNRLGLACAGCSVSRRGWGSGQRRAVASGGGARVRRGAIGTGARGRRSCQERPPRQRSHEQRDSPWERGAQREADLLAKTVAKSKLW